MEGARMARTTTGMMMRTTAARIHQTLRRLRKRSLEAEDTMADCSESKAAVLRVTEMTRTKPTSQGGSWSRSAKKATAPSTGALSGSEPGTRLAQTAMRPVEPTRVTMQRMATTAMVMPTQRSRSDLEAKVRS